MNAKPRNKSLLAIYGLGKEAIDWLDEVLPDEIEPLEWWGSVSELFTSRPDAILLNPQELSEEELMLFSEHLGGKLQRILVLSSEDFPDEMDFRYHRIHLFDDLGNETIRSLERLVRRDRYRISRGFSTATLDDFTVLLHVEVTGIDPITDRVSRISAIRLHGDREDARLDLALETDQHLAKGLDTLVSWAGRAPWVLWNSTFFLPYLQRAFRSVHIGVNTTVIDLSEIACTLVPGERFQTPDAFLERISRSVEGDQPALTHLMVAYGQIHGELARQHYLHMIDAECIPPAPMTIE